MRPRAPLPEIADLRADVRQKFSIATMIVRIDRARQHVRRLNDVVRMRPVVADLSDLAGRVPCVKFPAYVRGELLIDRLALDRRVQY